MPNLGPLGSEATAFLAVSITNTTYHGILSKHGVHLLHNFSLRNLLSVLATSNFNSRRQSQTRLCFYALTLKAKSFCLRLYFFIINKTFCDVWAFKIEYEKINHHVSES